MTAFAPFVAVAQPPVVERSGPDVPLTFRSTPRAPDAPIVRTDLPRHEGTSVLFMPLRPVGSAGAFALSSPATGVCRRIVLPTPGVAGIGTLLEISPLPFAIRRVLRRLPGLPTFYLGVATTETLPADDQVLSAGEQIANVSAALVGVVFGDRVAQPPAAWIELIGDALDGFAPAADLTAWRALQTVDPTSGRALHVRDHAGRPAASYQVEVNGIARSASPTGEVLLPNGDVSVRWIADDTGAPASGPVHARYEGRRNIDPAAIDPRGSSTPPGGLLQIPAGAVRPLVQLLDATRWFAARPAGLDPTLGQVHPDSRMQPLVDGIATYAALLEDLRHATGPGCGAHFAGWAFREIALDPSNEAETMFTDVIKSLRAGDASAMDPGDPPLVDAAGARFLMDQFFLFREDADTDAVRRLILVLLVLGTDVLILRSVAEAAPGDGHKMFIVGLATIAASLLATYGNASAVLDALQKHMDQTPELHAAFDEIKAGIALRSRHPGRWADNPLGFLPSQFSTIGFDQRDLMNGVSSYHQKFQVVRREADALGNRVIGYLGGVDIHNNRLDTWGHSGSAWRPPGSVSAQPSVQAFHDVHVRITGPAAADVAHTFQRRWEFDVSRQVPVALVKEPAFVAPDPTDAGEVPPQPARHIVQVCRSGYAPAPGSTSVPLPWSPLGENTISRGFVNAIDNAREFIYIEDQYFTPHDEYVHALLEASTRNDRSLRLVIVIPSNADNLFGDIRRRELFERLRKGDDPPSSRGWGDRLIVGAPMRRPVLADSGRIASRGRLVLFEALAANGDTVVLGPRSRLPPEVPFGLYIGGERMLAVERNEDLTVDNVPCRRYLVRRTGPVEPLWGGTPRGHALKAPVTLSQETGIYVHTKAMIVDDVFVGVGSCNTNRRGFFHDGEITAFAVPEQLKSAPDNPARALRCALWAEHLGIPPSMGPALLADPIAAADLFRRPTQVGNRLSSLAALGIKPEISLFDGEANHWVEVLQTLGIALTESLVPFVWNVFADPTTATDPLPAPGPALGSV